MERFDTNTDSVSRIGVAYADGDKVILIVSKSLKWDNPARMVELAQIVENGTETSWTVLEYPNRDESDIEDNEYEVLESGNSEECTFTYVNAAFGMSVG